MLRKKSPVLARRGFVVFVVVCLVVVATSAVLLVRAVTTSHAIDGSGSTSPASISGESMPVGDLPGWRQIFTDDFNNSKLGDNWGAYSGTPGGDPNSHWEQSHVAVTDSQLVLEGYQEDGQWVTGGVSNWPVTQTYGKWELRVRADASVNTTFHFLLWPQADQWPPEIDFLENFGGSRTGASGFLHYVDSSASNGRGKTERTVTADFTQWQTVGVEWLPGKVTYTLNGAPWGTVTGDNVPDQPMWMGLQAQASGCVAADQASNPSCADDGVTRADVQIDWVSIYAVA